MASRDPWSLKLFLIQCRTQFLFLALVGIYFKPLTSASFKNRGIDVSRSVNPINSHLFWERDSGNPNYVIVRLPFARIEAALTISENRDRNSKFALNACVRQTLDLTVEDMDTYSWQSPDAVRPSHSLPHPPVLMRNLSWMTASDACLTHIMWFRSLSLTRQCLVSTIIRGSKNVLWKPVIIRSPKKEVLSSRGSSNLPFGMYQFYVKNGPLWITFVFTTLAVTLANSYTEVTSFWKRSYEQGVLSVKTSTLTAYCTSER